MHRMGTRPLLLRVLSVVIGLVMALVFSEMLLRLCGFRPWAYSTIDVNEPTMHEPDPVLGWRSKAGSYVVPAYHPGGHPTHATFLEQGWRRSAPAPVTGAKGQLVLGRRLVHPGMGNQR